MVTYQELKDLIPVKVKLSQLKDKLNDAGVQSAYGFVTYAMEHRKPDQYPAAAFQDTDLIRRFVDQTKNEENSLAQHLYNAGLLLSKLVENDIAMSVVQFQLESAVMPHVLYFLYASAGLNIAEKYKADAIEYKKRYPTAVDKLPESCRGDL